MLETQRTVSKLFKAHLLVAIDNELALEQRGSRGDLPCSNGLEVLKGHLELHICKREVVRE